ncbi:MAPEG family protein [Larsenimonas salina]|uniref:MAPEG family protein n=1 Tax=Larsenimonas salina TaxID=1295565 RepID=UPI002072C5A0|nr:MAPEG family protein [Larsenimonas salina]MCM5705134.1 MAPEG family protein [Larsenimonas salina]
MALDRTQRRVLRGMALGMMSAVMIVLLGRWLDPFSLEARATLADRVQLAAAAMSVPALCVMVTVGRLAAHRFITPEDIDGGGLAAGSGTAKLLQALIQNTLEQAVLAIVAYGLWAAFMPPRWLSVVPLAAGLFLVGRVLFCAGYRRGAPARALGFTLCFYPSSLMLVGASVKGLATLF